MSQNMRQFDIDRTLEVKINGPKLFYTFGQKSKWLKILLDENRARCLLRQKVLLLFKSEFLVLVLLLCTVSIQT
jgi:hypothetical protein